MKLPELEQGTWHKSQGSWHKIGFDLRSNIEAPQESGCYAISNAYGEILYIGKAENIRDRMADHIRDPEKQHAGGLGASCWFFYKLIPNSEIGIVEESLLSTYKFKVGMLPPLNKIGG